MWLLTIIVHWSWWQWRCKSKMNFVDIRAVNTVSWVRRGENAHYLWWWNIYGAARCLCKLILAHFKKQWESVDVGKTYSSTDNSSFWLETLLLGLTFWWVLIVIYTFFFSVSKWISINWFIGCTVLKICPFKKYYMIFFFMIPFYEAKYIVLVVRKSFLPTQVSAPP